MKTWTFLLTVLLSGCAVIEISDSVNTREYQSAPIPGSDVYVYLAGDTIPEACESVAELDVTTEDKEENLIRIIERLREEAGELGANAVQVQSMERPGAGASFAAGFVGALFGDNDLRGNIDADAVALHCPSDLL